jgi:hypothetical protein
MQDSMQMVIASHYRTDTRPWIGDRAAMQEGARIASVIPHALQVSSAYYVEPDMTDLVVFASAGMDETDLFRYDELPTECGFAYFENPLVIRDVRNTDLFVNGLLWFSTRNLDPVSGEERSGTMIMMLNDHFTTPDDIAKEIMAGKMTHLDYDIYRAVLGRWGVIGFEMLYDGQQIGPPVATADLAKLVEIEAEGLVAHEFTNIRRQVHAFWLMLGQTITKVSDSEVPRAFARRAKKAKLPGRVTVVRLRRHEHPDHGVGETSVEWSCRWVVRGHWAWRACGSSHPLAEGDGRGGWRARVWIHNYLKGPEDKPLHVTNKIYHLAD